MEASSCLDCVSLDLHLADETLVAALSYLPAEGVARAARSCTRLWSMSQSDIVWLPLAAARWRFGSAPPGAGEAWLPPGLRLDASEEAARSAAQAEASGGRRAQRPHGPTRATGAGAFFQERVRTDEEVARLLAQYCAADPMGEGRAQGNGLGRGSVVEVRSESPGGEGVQGVVLGSGATEVAVLLPSMRQVRAARERLVACGEALPRAEIERRLAALGPDAVDQLARLWAGTSVSAPSPVRHAARSFLKLATERWAVQQWQQLMRDADRVDLLEEGGLVVSQWAEPGSAHAKDVRAFLAEIADAAAASISLNAPVKDRVAVVSKVLFDDYGFSGNVDNYYDARNSFLHSVLQRRRGIPISLSIVWTVVARRLHIPCFLCTDMPAHILIRVRCGETLRDDLYVDAFGRKVMDFDGLRAFLRGIGIGQFAEEWTEQRPATFVYLRLLRNLKNIFQEEASTLTLDMMDLSPLENLAATCSQMLTLARGDLANSRESQMLTVVREQANVALATHRSKNFTLTE